MQNKQNKNENKITLKGRYITAGIAMAFMFAAKWDIECGSKTWMIELAIAIVFGVITMVGVTLADYYKEVK